MTMIRSLIRYGRRKLHTIVSTEIIKPSFPTPSHLKTYNLSPADQFVPGSLMPFITFYPKIDTYHSPHDQILDLKNSLSQTLTKYYPLAGRHARIAPTYVDCNDHGAVFVEASMDSTLSNFLQNSQHEDLDQLFPYGRVWRHPSSRADHDLQTDTVTPLMVKASHFECGGLSVAVSLSHKIADACSMIHFFNDWAELNQVCSKVEKCEALIEPEFISFEHTNIKIPEFSPEVPKDCATRSFIFPNAKLNTLKLKVTAMIEGAGKHISKPTRVDVLTWLLYKCAVAAAIKNNSGFFKPSSILVMANLRDKMMEPLPVSCIGNFVKGLVVPTTTEREMKPELLIGELTTLKMGIRGFKNHEDFFSLLSNYKSDGRKTIIENAYICSSICWYPTYGINFGWGAPIKATLPGNLSKNSFLLMDTPKREGIEAIVCLEKQEMDIVQRDPELLAFCT